MKLDKLRKKTFCSQAAPGEYIAYGGGEGTRTPDPMVANHVLCQLSYTPYPIADCGFRIAEFINPQSAF
jgi:hypothetical protein